MKPKRITEILDNVDAGGADKHTRSDLDKLVMKGLLKVSLIGRKYSVTAAGQRYRLFGGE